MADERVFKLRVTYSKAGRLALLSHLEIARALERMVRRANLPYAVSQGFSPHMRIAFGSALPVGVGSACEIFDLALTDYRAPQTALAALQAAAPADLMPKSAEYLEPGAPAASVAFPVSVYRALIEWPQDFREEEESTDAFALPIPETITVPRKKGDKVYVVADYLEQAPVAYGPLVVFALRSRDTGSLRADVFLRSCLETLARAQVQDAVDAPKAYNMGLPQVRALTRIEQRAR